MSSNVADTVHPKRAVHCAAKLGSCARVVAAGFEGEKEPWDADCGQQYALLGDPDGVRVNLYARLA